jgi:hypothetical protein
MDPNVRSVLLAVGALFCFGFAAMTLVVIADSGLDILTLTSLVILALVGFGLIGAYRNPPQ